MWCGGGGNRGSVCAADMLAVVSGIREEVVTAAEKGVAMGAAAAEGIWAVVLAAAKVAMAAADNSGNGGAGNGGGNRGSSGATTINQNTAAVGGCCGGGCNGYNHSSIYSLVVVCAVHVGSQIRGILNGRFWVLHGHGAGARMAGAVEARRTQGTHQLEV